MTTTSQTRISPLRLRAQVAAVAFALASLLATGAAQRAQAQTFSVLHSFTNSDGALPFTPLVIDEAGNLYGTTSTGPSGYGTVFKLDTSGNETVLHSFAGPVNGGPGADGASPLTGLLLDTAGNLYGATTNGGSSGYGTVFKLDSSGNETLLYSFTDSAGDGAQPNGDLLIDKAGNLYGATELGGSTARYGDVGASGLGTVFKVDASGNETVLHIFAGPLTGGPGAEGALPNGDLVIDKAGNLYGTTLFGGSLDYGTVFKLDTSGNETVLHTFKGPFTGGPGTDGAYPGAGLIMDMAGNLYGTTERGGSSGQGTVFKLDTSGNETVLYSFTNSSGDGADPAGLVMDTAGNLYGTTAHGGSSGQGTVFKLDPSGNETVLHSFAGLDGDTPLAGLIMDAAGDLYGTTVGGGSSGDGTVFKVTLSVPFAAFAAKLDIAPPGFRLNGAFTLDSGATAIDPATQVVTLKVGTYTVTIPPGSLRALANGNFTYHGAINGVRLEIRIAPTGADAYEIQVKASGVKLSTLTNPVPVTLTLGNNTGTAEVTAEFYRHPD